MRVPRIALGCALLLSAVAFSEENSLTGDQLKVLEQSQPKSSIKLNDLSNKKILTLKQWVSDKSNYFVLYADGKVVASYKTGEGVNVPADFREESNQVLVSPEKVAQVDGKRVVVPAVYETRTRKMCIAEAGVHYKDSNQVTLVQIALKGLGQNKRLVTVGGSLFEIN